MNLLSAASSSFTCCTCHKSSLDFDQLVSHICQDHLNYLPWKCISCAIKGENRTFPSKSALDQHAIHSNHHSGSFRIAHIPQGKCEEELKKLLDQSLKTSGSTAQGSSLTTSSVSNTNSASPETSRGNCFSEDSKSSSTKTEDSVFPHSDGVTLDEMNRSKEKQVEQEMEIIDLSQEMLCHLCLKENGQKNGFCTNEEKGSHILQAHPHLVAQELEDASPLLAHSENLDLDASTKYWLFKDSIGLQRLLTKHFGNPESVDTCSGGEEDVVWLGDGDDDCMVIGEERGKMEESYRELTSVKTPESGAEKSKGAPKETEVYPGEVKRVKRSESGAETRGAPKETKLYPDKNSAFELDQDEVVDTESQRSEGSQTSPMPLGGGGEPTETKMEPEPQTGSSSHGESSRDPKIASKEKKYYCKECDIPVAIPDTHLISNHWQGMNIKPLQCVYCKYGCGCMESMIKHLVMVHRDLHVADDEDGCGQVVVPCRLGFEAMEQFEKKMEELIEIWKLN